MKHVLCTLNDGGYAANGGPRLIGCSRHRRTRRGVKKDYAVYGIHTHCWCGLDLKLTWTASVKDPWYEVFEKTFCSPERHFSDYVECLSRRKYKRARWGGGWELGPVTSCGLHGLTYTHCRLCAEALPGEVEGMVNGEWSYSPWTLAKKIYKAMASGES